MPKKSSPKQRPIKDNSKSSTVNAPIVSKTKFQKNFDSFKYSFTTTLIFALTALAFWSLLLMLKEFIGFDLFNWFKELPFVYPAATYVAAHIKQRSFEGIVYAFSFSSVFFIPSPLEVLFIGFINFASSPIRIIFPAFLGLMLGQHFNFFMGRLFGKLVRKLIKKKIIILVQRRVRDYGAVAIFFINLLPLPYPITNFLVGSLRYSYTRWLIFTSLAIAIKLVFIAWVYVLFL